MLYDEFIKGTGCKATEHNYQIFKGIETIYNHTESMTKEDAYRLARPFIDDMLTEDERRMVEWIDNMLSIRLDEMADLLEDLRQADRRMEAWNTAETLPDDELMALCMEASDACEDHDRAERDLTRNEAERMLLERMRADITSGRYR